VQSNPENFSDFKNCLAVRFTLFVHRQNFEKLLPINVQDLLLMQLD